MIEEIDMDIPYPNDPDIFDPACDPKNPIKITFKSIQEARERIKNYIAQTTCSYTRISSEVNMELYLKKESEHATGSFKERGACNTLISLTNEQKKIGTITASSGNHASAMAYHGKNLNIPVTVVMPANAPLPKIKNCTSFGAKVILKGATILDARAIALKLAKTSGLTYINGYDHANIISGQGTIGCEVLEQVPNLDAIIVPVGGGGLLAGVSLAIKSLNPKVLVYGAESKLCASFKNALDAGFPVDTPCSNTIADGLLVPIVGVNAFATAAPHVDKIVNFDEKYIVRAILKLVETEKDVVEGAGATSLGAIISNQFPELKGKKVVCLVTGGNIDTIIFGRVLDRALAVEGRLIRISVVTSDRIGGISELCQLVKDQGVCIREIFHNRCWLSSDVYSVQIKCLAETRDAEHAKQLYNALGKRYSSLTWKHC